MEIDRLGALGRDDGGADTRVTTALIVAAEPDIRHRLRDDLQDSGIEVRVAATVTEATTAVADHETQAQHDRLEAMGCALGQGYFYGRPAPAAEVAIERAGFIPDLVSQA